MRICRRCRCLFAGVEKSPNRFERFCDERVSTIASREQEQGDQGYAPDPPLGHLPVCGGRRHGSGCDRFAAREDSLEREEREREGVRQGRAERRWTAQNERTQRSSLPERRSSGVRRGIYETFVGGQDVGMYAVR